MEVYLDNSATTQCAPDVKDIIVKTLMEDYGNPSSLHQKGIDAEKYVRHAAEQIAKTLHCKEREIIFTSGGTESNNMALIGAARANCRSGRHIISTMVEHPSVKKTLLYLEEKERFKITWLPCDRRGMADLDALRDALDDETILVSVMMVNNELGTREPIEEIRRILDEAHSKALFHVDAIQAYGKYKINPKKEGIDLLSVSGHKIHGPKGIGFLYIKDRTKINAINYGGGQQQGMRSGTINVPGIAGLGLAAEDIYTDFSAKTDRMYQLKDYLIEHLQKMDEVSVNSIPGRESAPQIVNASFLGIRSEVMLHALEERGIFVSSGSACASNHPADNSTLKNVGLPPEITDSAIRFSLSIHTTKEEIDYTLENIAQLVPILRKYQRH